MRFVQPPKQNLVNATAKIELRLFLVENMQKYKCQFYEMIQN